MRALESLQTSGVEIVLGALVPTASFACVSSFSNGGMCGEIIITRANITAPHQPSIAGPLPSLSLHSRAMHWWRRAAWTFFPFLLSTLRVRFDMSSVSRLCSKSRFVSDQRPRRLLRTGSHLRRSRCASPHRPALLITPTGFAILLRAYAATYRASPLTGQPTPCSVDAWCA